MTFDSKNIANKIINKIADICGFDKYHIDNYQFLYLIILSIYISDNYNFTTL